MKFELPCSSDFCIRETPSLQISYKYKRTAKSWIKMKKKSCNFLDNLTSKYNNIINLDIGEYRNKQGVFFSF